MELKVWFEEKDYGLGLAILGNHCKNRVLLQNLGRKRNPEKLEYELAKVAKEQGIVIGATGKKAGKKSTRVKKTKGNKQQSTESHSDQVIDQMNNDIRNDNPDILPKHLQVKWHENHDAYKEIRALHEKLKLMEKATPEDRQPLTERIANLDDKIRANWEAIDAWQPGAEPSEKPEVKIDHKRIQANRKYISTNLKKLPEVVDPVKKAKIIAELQYRFNELKSAGEEVATETITELAKAGVIC